MSRLTDTLRNVFKIEELRQRILFTALMLLVVRVGSFISVPGINVSAIHAGSGSNANNSLFGLFDMFVGGAYTNAAIFSLGIMPYISASIIVQLLGAVVPYFQKMQQEGEQGRKQLTTITRYLTVVLAFAQGIAIAVSHFGKVNGGLDVVSPELGRIPFLLMAATIFTAGTIFLMWVGEQITEKGIGNGTSLIIFIGIIARLPHAMAQEWSMVAGRTRNPLVELVIMAGFLAIIAVVVLFTQAVRKIPVQYAKRMVGNKSYSGQMSYIPIQLITANVMPIIFASAIMFVPNLIPQVLPGSGLANFINQHFKYTDPLHALVQALLIVFFAFFYTAIVVNARDVAENMRKSGGFIPGVRPGKPTEEYVDSVLMRVTVPGALFLAVIAILPMFVQTMGVSAEFATFFGGTSVLIMVGVAIDTLKQIESYLLMRHYDGFMKSGKLRGRLGRQQVVQGN